MLLNGNPCGHLTKHQLDCTPNSPSLHPTFTKIYPTAGSILKDNQGKQEESFL